ncbi:MAG: DUF4011 domain-containing protein [Phycisphaerae bacterium]
MMCAIQIDKELDRFRKRLLDLNRNNRLLNYRKSRRRTLQIIDELPNQIFDRLVNEGKEFRFRALPKDTEKLRETSSLWNEDEAVRVELPEQPDDESQVSRRHSDSRLQTDLEEDDLDRVLKSIRSHARSAIEETGVNFLYLALGLLEWTEDQQSSLQNLAPLVLIPIRIDRKFDGRSHRYEYNIYHDGEEVQTNLCLAKKLETDHGLELPELEEAETPEEYFNAVRRCVSRLQGWQVRREALIGFFSFRKLLMYLDLDPENWPEDSLRGNDLLRSVFEGSQTNGDQIFFSSDYDIDGNETAEHVALATDADSSQHSALCDIAEGKTLVIEGPPGTGKSQTITNAIGNALNNGKTVLFVSEKLAALDVVRRKLKDLGLDDFCLELHSDAASPAKVMDQLRRRLDKRFPAPKRLLELRDKVRSQKKKLAAYIEACRQPTGPNGDPLDEVFWRAAELRSAGVRPIREVDVDHLVDEDQFERRTGALEELARHVEEVGSPPENPWHWFFCPDLRSADVDQVMELVAALSEAAGRLEQAGLALVEEVGGELTDWLHFARRTNVENLVALEVDSRAGVSSLCQRALLPGQREILEEYAQRERAYRQSYKRLSQELPVSLQDALTEARKLQELDEAVATEPVSRVPVNRLPEVRSSLDGLEKALQEVLSLSASLEDQGYGEIKRLWQLRIALEKYSLIHHPAISSQDQLNAVMFMEYGERAYAEAYRQYSNLSSQADELSNFFDLEDVPSKEEVDALRRQLREYVSSPLRLLSPSYRAARRKLNSFRQPGMPAKLSKRVELLKQLSTFLQERKDFSNHPGFLQALAPLFKGYETDWQALRDTIRWAKTAHAAGLTYNESVQLLAQRFGEAQSATPAELKAAATRFESELQADILQPLINEYATSSEFVDLEHLMERIRTITPAIDRLLDCASYLARDSNETLAAISKRAHRALNLDRERNAIDTDQRYAEVLRDVFDGVQTDITELCDLSLAWLHQLDCLRLPQATIEWLRGDELHQQCAKLAERLHALVSCFEDVQKAIADLQRWGQVLKEVVSVSEASADDPARCKVFRRALSSREKLLPWANYCRASSYVSSLQLAEFASAVGDGRLDAQLAAQCYELMVYEKAANECIQNSKVLAKFSRQRLEKAREKFQKLDRELLELQRRAIAANAAKARPPAGVSKGRVRDLTEMGLIRNECGKQRRLCPIRKLLSRAGRAVQALKPCFMMSPLSVAQYIRPGGLEFDLVLMDEASQIKPEDALGTVARAKQLVVVGDPKQLPPTSFFDSVAASDVDEDEALVADDTESILEVAMKAFPHVRRLKWHYRSQHESLIAFSNDRFYDGDLVAFPSPTSDSGRLGVRHHFVDAGAFQGGCNPNEAEAVANAIVEHAKANPEESLGVGTFNAKQRTLIEDMLDRLCMQNSQSRHAVEKLSSGTDGLFIKNLENLQGDERDVIFISYTYGPDPQSGRVANRFGPITFSNGWRRLNVLITRARKRVEVFSSMTPDDILGGPNKSKGVNAMRDYLDYAQTGWLKNPGSPSGREPESPFELAVARVVRRMGLDVVPQVGVAGYFIDLGVLKPDGNGEFLLGIECDGATYHSSKSARDRDRLREEVIRSRGWQIHRVWSTDWFLNQETEEVRLQERIRGLL